MNERGSVTIFLVLVTMVFVSIFGFYFNHSVRSMVDNNIIRAAQNTSRNIEASYESNLYEHYGILAYKKETALEEAKLSLEESFTKEKHVSLVPYQFINDLEYKLEKSSDLLDLDQTLGQMKRQALIHVPMEFIENQNIVKDLIKKTSQAKAKVKEIEKLSKVLKKLKKYDEKLGNLFGELATYKNNINLVVYRTGSLSINLSSLESNIASIEDKLYDAIKEMARINDQINEEQKLLQLSKDVYPPGFKENIWAQLEDMKLNKSTAFTSSFEVSGVHITNTEIDQYVNEKFGVTRSTNATGVEGMIGNYAQGLLGLKKITVQLKQLEDDLKVYYQDDLEYINELNRKIKFKVLDRESKRFYISKRNELIKDMDESIQSDLDAFLDVYDVFTYEKSQPLLNRAYENYYKELSSMKLSTNESSIIKSTSNVSQDLSNNRIDSKMATALPSSDRTLKLSKITTTEQFMLTEYLMGTFKHRLSDQFEEEKNHLSSQVSQLPADKTTLKTKSQAQRPKVDLQKDGHNSWDFYNKFERNTFFDDGELEYILVGEKSEAQNRRIVAQRIFLIREASNLVHVYTCKDKITTATDLSTVLAWPPWTKPIFYNGIMIGWASIESHTDVQKLLDGEKIPTLKISDSDWFTQIKFRKESQNLTTLASSTSKTAKNYEPNKATAKSKALDVIQFNQQSYPFYLRLLFNMQLSSEEDYTKEGIYIKRALDLMILNKDIKNFDLTELWTGHKLYMKAGGKAFELEENY